VLGHRSANRDGAMSMEVVKKKGTEEEEYLIKPQAATPAIDTSNWPLLLKNYDKCE
jgi:H/ACA ribonucleoprotein complex subunit 4